MRIFFLLTISLLLKINLTFSQLKATRNYQVLGSLNEMDSVINLTTNERIWVKRDSKIFFVNPSVHYYKDHSGFIDTVKSSIERLNNFYNNMPGNELDSPKNFGVKYKMLRSVKHFRPNFEALNIQIKKTCDCDYSFFELEGSNLHLYDFFYTPGDGSACNNPKSICNSDNSIQQIKTINQISNFISSTVITDSLDSDFDCRGNSIKIAILDTGILLDSLLNSKTRDSSFVLKHFFNKNLQNYPNKLTDIGQINLVDQPDSLTEDSYHGTKVANIILTQIKAANVKIIPIKISNDCPGNLFEAMCGVLTAIKADADLVNASWLFEGERKIVELTSKIFFILNKSNIILVNSAGNQNTNLTDGKVITKRQMQGSDFSQQQLRYSEKTYYPANYTKLFNNIISVSTLKKIGNSLYDGSRTNYSKEYISTGVLCQCSFDQHNGGYFERIDGFYIPGFKKDSCYFGTSFAAAYLTGKLASTINSTLQENLINNLNSLKMEWPSGPVLSGSYNRRIPRRFRSSVLTSPMPVPTNLSNEIKNLLNGMGLMSISNSSSYNHSNMNENRYLIINE